MPCHAISLAVGYTAAFGAGSPGDDFAVRCGRSDAATWLQLSSTSSALSVSSYADTALHRGQREDISAVTRSLPLQNGTLGLLQNGTGMNDESVLDSSDAADGKKAEVSPRPDSFTFALAILAGVCIGTYPVPVKSQRVLEANAHPVVFQCYKCLWAFLTGWLFVLVRFLRGVPLPFEFSWLGVVSAAAWIPAGILCIAAVPRLGVAVTLACVNCTATIVGSSLAWAFFGERMRFHVWRGTHVYMAPVYMAAIAFGICVLVSLSSSKSAAKTPQEEVDEGDNKHLKPAKADGAAPERQRGHFALSVLLACCAGVLHPVQVGTILFARQRNEMISGCASSNVTCPPELVERFNPCGSWMASFGIGVMFLLPFVIAGLWTHDWLRGRPLTGFNVPVLLAPGSLSGLLWSAGNALQVSAVARGGAAVMLPAVGSSVVIASGLWGIFYYGEVRGARRYIWAAAALWTAAAVWLLNGERLQEGGAAE